MTAHSEGRLARLVKGDSGGGESAPASIADDAINNNNVVVFSKSFCPFCTKVKDLLDSLHVRYEGER